MAWRTSSVPPGRPRRSEAEDALVWPPTEPAEGYYYGTVRGNYVTCDSPGP